MTRSRAAVATFVLLLAACTAPPAARTATPAAMGGHGAPGDGLMAMGTCEPAAPPIGAIPPVPPAWCVALRSGVATAVSGPNSWRDDFASGADMAVFPPGYRVFEAARPSLVFRTKTFAHNGHWMVDVAARASSPAEYEGDPRDLETGAHYGGALVRPDRTFRAVAGTLVVEFEVAAGMLAYHDGWPELVVTTAAAPTGLETDPIHAIGLFGGAPAVGCRLYSDRTSSCSAFDGTGRSIAAGGRIFEVSAERSEGAATSVGGSPASAPVPAAWRTCAPAAPDTDCRDRFRVTFASDAVRVEVNGVTWMDQRGLPPGHRVPGALVAADVYVYFASWVYLGEAGSERFHWGGIAINPD